MFRKLIEMKCLISQNKILPFGIALKNYLRIIIWQLLDYKPGCKMRAGQQAISGQKLFASHVDELHTLSLLNKQPNPHLRILHFVY